MASRRSTLKLPLVRKGGLPKRTATPSPGRVSTQPTARRATYAVIVVWFPCFHRPRRSSWSQVMLQSGTTIGHHEKHADVNSAVTSWPARTASAAGTSVSGIMRRPRGKRCSVCAETLVALATNPVSSSAQTLRSCAKACHLPRQLSAGVGHLLNQIAPSPAA